MMRVGFGYDSHRFCEGNHIMIGGVRVPHHAAFLAHSDGDVLLHAVGDALLGAAALGDIGQHFPDTDTSFKDADSAMLIGQILKLLKARSLSIHNIDATLIAEQPKFSSLMVSIRQSLADIIGLPISQVSVKATTNEKMGSLGRSEGIAAHVVVLISNDPSE
tara:strand:+ start:5419 stop:5904 length:486 start_codon:yes stop_codon:yes gene_type:complete